MTGEVLSDIGVLRSSLWSRVLRSGEWHSESWREWHLFWDQKGICTWQLKQRRKAFKTSRKGECAQVTSTRRPLNPVWLELRAWRWSEETNFLGRCDRFGLHPECDGESLMDFKQGSVDWGKTSSDSLLKRWRLWPPIVGGWEGASPEQWSW